MRRDTKAVQQSLDCELGEDKLQLYAASPRELAKTPTDGSAGGQPTGVRAQARASRYGCMTAATRSTCA